MAGGEGRSPAVANTSPFRLALAIIGVLLALLLAWQLRHLIPLSFLAVLPSKARAT